MDPVTLGVAGGSVAGAALGGYLQYRSSEQARKDTAAERQKIEDLVNRLQSPDLNGKPLTPEEYQLVGKFAPEVAQYIQEQAPQLLTQTQDYTTGKNAQLDALKEYRDIAARGGQDPAFTAAMDLASRRSSADAESRQQAVLQDAQRRGQSGSLQTLMAQLQGNESSNSRNAEMQRQAQMEAYKNKLSALSNSAQLGGQIANQDTNFQKTNMDVINDFNRRMASNYQNYVQYAAGQRNDAQRQNLQNAQAVKNANTQAGNQFMQSNRDMANQVAQGQFNNELSKIGQQSGVANNAINDYRQNAQDRNNMIQGFTNAGTAFGKDYISEEDKRKDRAAKYGYYES